MMILSSNVSPKLMKSCQTKPDDVNSIQLIQLSTTMTSLTKPSSLNNSLKHGHLFSLENVDLAKILLLLLNWVIWRAQKLMLRSSTNTGTISNPGEALNMMIRKPTKVMTGSLAWFT